MSNLSRSWKRQKRALATFLRLPLNDPDGKIPIVRAWLTRLTGLPDLPSALPPPPYPPVPGSPESALHGALETLENKHQAVSTHEGAATPEEDEDKRRSDKLARMVQGAIGARQGGHGFYAGIADVVLSTADQLNAYRAAVREASEAAARFIRIARNTGVINGPQELVSALKSLIDENGGVDPDILNEIRKLKDSIRETLPREGGGGDGSAFWPSVWVSSSSSSGG